MRKRFGMAGGIDLPLAAAVLLLSAFSVVNIYSAAQNSGEMTPSHVWVQLIAIALGTICAGVMSFADFERVGIREAIGLGLLSVIALILPLFIGVGSGNISWIPLAGTQLYIQTSEFVKITYIITLAAHFGAVRERLNTVRSLSLICAHGIAGAALVAVQGDVGSALVYIMIFLSMLYAAGVKPLFFAAAGAGAAALSPLLWKLLGAVRQARLTAGLDPYSDPLGYGWQAILSMNAVSEGGLFGRGYMRATVSAILPACCTDLMLARVCEEFGALCGIAVIALLGFVIIRMMTAQAPYKSRLVCAGIAAWIMWQTIESVGMTLGILPIVGVTLPYMSYGGSSMTALLIAAGIVISIEKRNAR